MIRRLIILLLIVGCVFAESKSTIITNKGNTVEYVFGSYKPQQDQCLSKEKREKIQRQLNENILRLNIDQQLLRANEHALFEWPLSLNDESNDYGYHGVSGFVDNNLNYNNNLLDYNCGNRTYDTEDYNHQGTDYFLWPFNWDKVENDVVSVVAASPGIIVGKSDGNYDKNCGGWDTDYSTEWNAVYVQNDDGSISWYGHMKNGSLTNKSFGDTVKVGEYLGIVASSGISTGPHLHFETYKDNTYTHLIDPYYGDCNNHNADSWWIAQRPYYDSAINKIMTHSGYPEFYWDECAKPANINAENNFTPNNYIYFGAYYRDQLSDQVSQWSLIDPEGNIYDAWEQTLEDVDHYPASYWWYYYLFNNTVIKGEWTFQIIYNEKQYEHKFLICDNDVLPDDACDCNGNIEDECGVCGGDNSTCTGCMNDTACNYNIDATIEGDCIHTDGVCETCVDGVILDNDGDGDGVCDDMDDCEGYDDTVDTDGDGTPDGCDLSLYEGIIPDNYSISSIYPNPFNPVTNITYGLPEHVNVQIVVYDLSGKQVETLINQFQTPGYHSVNWDADNLPSGVYLIKMDSGEFTQTQKVVLVK